MHGQNARFFGSPQHAPKYSKNKFRKRFIVINKNPRNMFIYVHYVCYVYLDISHTIYTYYISYMVHLLIYIYHRYHSTPIYQTLLKFPLKNPLALIFIVVGRSVCYKVACFKFLMSHCRIFCF